LKAGVPRPLRSIAPSPAESDVGAGSVPPMIVHRPDFRFLSVCLLIACAAFTPRAAPAQEVLGGIQGKAADSSGAPLAGVRVTLVGSAFAATADADGRYAVVDVPAGEYTLRAELTGYGGSEVAVVLVRAGGSVRVDFALRAGADMTPAPAPPSPLAPPSQVTSETLIPGDLLRDLPVDDARQALALAPGVVMRGGEIGIDSTPTLSLRGGDPGTASVYVDGAPVRFETLGTQQLALGTNAISQMSVVTGPPSTLARDAGGGVISYITRAGGPRFTGSFWAASDAAFPAGAAVGYNRFEGALGGPLPIAPHLTWFVSAALHGQRSDYRGLGAADQPTYVMAGLDTVVTVNKANGSGVQSVPMPKFVQYSGQCTSGSNDGYGCQGLRLPMDWSTARRGQAKVLYTYGAGSSLSLTGVTSALDQRFFPGTVIGDPLLYRGAQQTSRLGVVNWTQGLGRLSHGPLTLNVNLSVATDGQLSGPLDPASELATRDPALGIDFSTLHFTAADSIPFPLTDRIIRNVRANQGLRVPFIGRSDLLATQPYRMNPYGLSSAAGWYTGGVDDGGLLTQVWERRWNGRAFLDWEPGRLQRVSLGGDVERTDGSYYTATLTDNVGLDAFLVHPRRWGVFADYRVQSGALVIDAGVRLDRFDAGGEFPKTPGRISSNPAWNRAAFTSDSAYANSVARVFSVAAGQRALSPRLRLTYAVSPRTTVRLGYGQQVEPPSFRLLFQNANSDLSFTSGSGLFGRDVAYVKSAVLEFGVRQAVGRALAADVSIYRKSHLQPYSYRTEDFPDPATPGATLQENVLTSGDLGAGTGLDAQLQWRRSAVTGSLAYSLLRVPSALAGTPDVTSHALSALVILRVPETWKAGTVWGIALADLSAVATFRLTSGLPYTRLVNMGAGIVAPAIDGGLPAEMINSSRLPTTKTFDLRLGKGFHSRGVKWSVYADLRNLLNVQNTLGVFAETGTTANDANRQRFEYPELATLRTEAQNNNALLPDGSVDVRTCAGWKGDAGPVNCVSLRRVEARFGDGNGIYSPAEQQKALDIYYTSFLGAWRFFGPGRTARLGMELRF
jgi:carboxypeptidase family protein/TonB-dependent receptor-like protein